jgi:SAM-dependent methyltransferase
LGATRKAVLEQSFPDAVNNHIHAIHTTEILHALPTDARKILDVGCGWGRVSKEIAKICKGTIYGIDPSSLFVRKFNTLLRSRGKARVGDMRRLPYAKDSFDFVYTVASFMYMETYKDRKKALGEMFRVLKPGGRICLIEPNTTGVTLFQLWGIVPYIYRVLLGKPKVESYGSSFSLQEMSGLVNESSGRVITVRGYPLFTIFLLPSVIVGKVAPTLAGYLLWITHALDKFIRIPDMSYFVTWVIKKT